MRSVAVTRPEPQASGTAQRLAAAGHYPMRLPLLTLEPLGSPVLPGGTGALAFTSRTAPMLLAGRADLKALPVFAVGDSTAREAARAGFITVTSAAGDVGALARLILAVRPSGTVVHLCGEDQRGDLVGVLRAANLAAERRILYRMVAATTLPSGPADMVTLYSPRSAAIFAALAAGTAWRGARCAVLSPEVAAPLAGRFALTIADAPTEAALLHAVGTAPH